MGFFDQLSTIVQAGFRVADTALTIYTQGAKAALDGILGGSLNGPRHLRETFEQLGATYIKLGQFIASTPGIFPKDYVDEMQKCFNDVAPLPFSSIKQTIHEEFHGAEDDIFGQIDEKPLASASIAQVHAARLRTGEDVVVKVQRPGIEKKLYADMNLLYLAAILFDRLARGSMTGNLRKIIEDFHHTIVEEVDFLKEAQNIERFRDFLDEIGESSITAPKVYHRATTVRVLTMERLYGVPLTDLDSIKKLVDDPEERLITTMNTWFQSLLFCDFFHADVHAGNLMVLVDGRVAFIDFGIVGRTGKEFWRGLTKLINGLMTADYRMLAEALVEMNATSGDVDIETFASQLEEIFTESNWISFKLLTEGVVDEARINYILDRMIQVCRDNGLTIPREFVLLIKQVLYFDRYVRILAPNLTTVLPAGAGKAAGRSILSKIEYVP